jgi:hypothetical protein
MTRPVRGGRYAGLMNRPTDPSQAPVQQKLFALLYEVRDLLHRVLPADAGVLASNVLRTCAPEPSSWIWIA